MTYHEDWPPELDHLHIPEARPDAVMRLIAAAQPREISPVFGWRDIWAYLIQPKLALSITCCLLVGIFLGWEASFLLENTEILGDVPHASDSFLADSGDIL